MTDTHKKAEIPRKDLKDNLVCANGITKPPGPKATTRKSLYSVVYIYTIRCFHHQVEGNKK